MEYLDAIGQEIHVGDIIVYARENKMELKRVLELKSFYDSWYEETLPKIKVEPVFGDKHRDKRAVVTKPSYISCLTMVMVVNKQLVNNVM